MVGRKIVKSLTIFCDKKKDLFLEVFGKFVIPSGILFTESVADGDAILYFFHQFRVKHFPPSGASVLHGNFHQDFFKQFKHFFVPLSFLSDLIIHPGSAFVNTFF